MGVTNPGSFLNNIPSLCDKAAECADRGKFSHLVRKLSTSVHSPETAAASGWVMAFTGYTHDGLAHLSLGM